MAKPPDARPPEDVARENERLRQQVQDLERKVDHLQRETEHLATRWEEEAASSTRFEKRVVEVEEELCTLANLYVASNQLHSTLDLSHVARHLRELLAQLVGASSHAVYLFNETRTEAVAVFADGVEPSQLPVIRARKNGAREREPEGAIERALFTGEHHLERGPLASSGPSSPAACIPMRAEDRLIGAIVIYSVLPHKDRFSPVDFAMFEMLDAHAATALMGALLHAEAKGKLPEDLPSVPKLLGSADQT